MTTPPAPGSPEAVAAGCTCRRKRATLVDADTGENLDDVWMVLLVHNCPLHGPADDPIGDELYMHADKLKPAGETGGGDA